MSNSNSQLKILFQITGSIAAYKACDVISQLVKQGHQVQVCCSQSAFQFVGPATLEGLSGRPVVSDLYASGNMMDHIHLVRWADIIVVAPATANYINKISAGIGDDLLSTQFLAHDFKKPFLIFPAMNTAMYEHPITKKSIHSLQQLGIQVHKTGIGDLACGENGSGRLLEPEQILEQIESAYNAKSNQKKVLITSGGTQESIDAVRVLTNLSTGSTGATIAEQMIAAGFDVTYLHSQNSKMPSGKYHPIAFTCFADIANKMQQLITNENFDVIIHAAAISDFSIDNPTSSKISSDQDLVIHLKRNPKIVSQLRVWSKNKKCQIFAFKMTANASEENKQAAVNKLFRNTDVDYVIQNDISEITQDQHRFVIYKQQKNELESVHRSNSNDNNASNFLEQNAKQPETNFLLKTEISSKKQLAHWFCKILNNTGNNENLAPSQSVQKSELNKTNSISNMTWQNPEVKI